MVMVVIGEPSASGRVTNVASTCVTGKVRSCENRESPKCLESKAGMSELPVTGKSEVFVNSFRRAGSPSWMGYVKHYL